MKLIKSIIKFVVFYIQILYWLFIVFVFIMLPISFVLGFPIILASLFKVDLFAYYILGLIWGIILTINRHKLLSKAEKYYIFIEEKLLKWLQISNKTSEDNDLMNKMFLSSYLKEQWKKKRKNQNLK